MKRDRLLLEKLRNGEHLGFMDRLTLVLVLSYPTVVAMLTSVMTEYIDAAMVGRLGAKKAASIGLISSTMWLDMSAYTDDSERLAEDIRKRTGLYLSAGSIYRGNGSAFLRMNVACPRSLVEDGIGRLQEALDEKG